MANYATLIAAIQSVITQNGNNEITGPILQQTLISVVNSLGSGYQFIGIATPETTPGTPDQKVFYIGASGTYPNFGPAVIPDGHLAVFYYDSSWHYGSVAFPLGDNAVSTSKIQDGAITLAKLAQSLKDELFSSGYKYIGVANQNTTPGTPDQKVFYLASAGTYNNFGFVVESGQFGVFKYNGTSWELDTINPFVESQTPINVNGYSNSPCCLGNRTTGWYNTNQNTLYHKAIPVSPGETYILTLTSVSSGLSFDGAYYALVTNSYAANPTKGTAIPFIGDTDRIPLDAHASVRITIPQTAAYIIINMIDGQGSTNTWELSKIGSSILGTIAEIEADISEINAQIEDLQEQVESGAAEIPVDSSLFLDMNGYIGTDGKYTSFDSATTTYGSIMSAADLVGKTITFRNDTPKMIRYAFLKSVVTNASNFCTGTTLVTLDPATESSAIIPSDCLWIYVYKSYSGENRFPDHITISSSVDEIVKRIDDISDQIGNGNFPEFNVISSTPIGTLSSATGYVNTNGTWYKTTSANYQGAFIDATPYVGKRIRIIRNANRDYTRYAFVVQNKSGADSTTYPIFCRGCSLVSNYNPENPIDVVPQDCKYIYFMKTSGGNDVTPQTIEVIEEKDITEILNDNAEKSRICVRENYDVAKIFNYYFPNMAQTPETLSGMGDATIDGNGLTLPVGFAYHITHNKMFLFDEEKITLEITATVNDKILCYSTSNSSGAISNADVNSFILFDFVNGRISIYKAGTINTSTGNGTELDGINFTVGAGQYIITYGRKQRAPFASIYNKTTREYREIWINEKSFESVNSAIRPAGWLYYYPAFSVLAGSPVFKRFVGTAPTDLFMLFQGDSYTQGYAGMYYNCWAKRAAIFFGNSSLCPISGGTLANIITQYHDSIKGKIKVKFMVISIGINDMSALDTDAKINTWANNFLAYLDELVSDGITPIVNRIWPEGSTTTATATKAQKMNNKIRSFGYDGADFGAVPGYSNNANYYLSSHLSVGGNKLTYDIFVNELLNYYIGKM